MPWSGYRCHVRNSFVKRLKTNPQINKTSKEECRNLVNGKEQNEYTQNANIIYDI